MNTERRVGLLALQGDFPTHAEALERFGLESFYLKTARSFARAGEMALGLVLPGGESTTMLNLIEREGLERPLALLLSSILAAGRPILATCAGLILIATRVEGPAQKSLGLIDVDVERNAYGRQLASGTFACRGEAGFPDSPGTFIRAPRIARVGPEVSVLLRRGADPVLVRQGALLAATFHPELDEHHPAYALFVDLLAAAEATRFE